MPTLACAGATGILPVAREALVDRLRRLAEQQGEGVLGLPQRVLQRRDLRLRLADQRLRLLDVELADLAVLELDGRDAQALLLRREVLLRDVDALLRGPDVDVVRRHVGDDRDERVVVGGDRAEVGRRSDSMPRRILPQTSSSQVRAKPRLSVATLSVVGRLVWLQFSDPDGALRLRKEVPDRLAQLRAGLRGRGPRRSAASGCSGTPPRPGRRGRDR